MFVDSRLLVFIRKGDCTGYDCESDGEDASDYFRYCASRPEITGDLQFREWRLFTLKTLGAGDFYSQVPAKLAISPLEKRTVPEYFWPESALTVTCSLVKEMKRVEDTVPEAPMKQGSVGDAVGV